MSRSDRRRVALCAALLASAVSAAPAAAAPPPACESIAVSPAFRRDRTVVCVHRANSQAVYTLGVSTDGGRTWRTPPMNGLLRPDPGGVPLSVSLSPSFGQDRALFATTMSGTFVSTDLGQTFAAVDTLARDTNSGNPSPYVTAPLVLPVPGQDTAPRVHLAYASSVSPAVIDVASRVRRPALGVPGRGAVRFVGTGTAVLAAVYEPDAATAGERLAVYACDAALTCAVPLFGFPGGLRLDDRRLDVLPDGSLVAVLNGDERREVWRSSDGGRTFARWQPVDRLLAPVHAAGGVAPSVALAAAPGVPRRLYLRVDKARPPGGWDAAMPPASQVFRSDDSGTTWRRVAYARGNGQRGSRGNAPWTTPGRGGIGRLVLAPDGRLFASGGTEAAITTFCSIDGGLRWTVGCR